MFKTLTRAVVLTAIAGGLSLAAVAPAQAQTTDPAVGRRCSFSSVTDPTIENGETQTGQINGGPLMATTPGAQISMTCTIQVGAANSTHAGADSCAVSSATQLQVTAIAPTLCSYLSPEGQPVYMCTQATVGGVTYYWDGTTGGAGGWSTSNAVGCNEAISQEILPGPLCNLAALSPGLPVPGIVEIGPDGDLYILGIWFTDCKPYDNPRPGPWFPDPVVCPILSGLQGLYLNGWLWIDDDGDVYIYEYDPTTGTGTWVRWWDCPPLPYGDDDSAKYPPAPFPSA